MRPLARIGIFAAALALAAGAAAAIGSAVGPLERGAGDEPAHEERMETRVLALEHLAGPSLRFRVTDSDGRAVRAFDVLHERRMHVIVVRRDLTGFRHLHPRMSASGTWQVPLALPAPGTWTAFADFSTGGVRQTLSVDLNAPGAFRPRPWPEPRSVARTGRYLVRLSGDVRTGELRFAVERDGRPVAVEPYLGARGHLVVLRNSDLHYLHVHAEADALAFEADWPSSGRYRAFLQFKHGGAVRTAVFDLRV